MRGHVMAAWFAPRSLGTPERAKERHRATRTCSFSFTTHRETGRLRALRNPIHESLPACPTGMLVSG